MIPGSPLDETGSLRSGVELTNSECSILSEERTQGEAATKGIIVSNLELLNKNRNFPSKYKKKTL